MSEALSKRLDRLEDLESIPGLGAKLAAKEINILMVTDDYILYEFSYIGENKMKKWAKRLAPLYSNIAQTYRYTLEAVQKEREAMGQ